MIDEATNLGKISLDNFCHVSVLYRKVRLMKINSIFWPTDILKNRAN